MSHSLAAPTALAPLLVLLAAGAAAAYPATATTALNVRTGPGTQFGVVGVLQRDQPVEVIACGDTGWCEIESDTMAGWASSRYLSRTEENSTPLPEPETTTPLPDSDVTFAIETPDFTFSIGSGERPGFRPPQSGRACFFEREGFQGREFCVGSGDSDLYLAPAWANTIRSVAIEGELELTVCTDTALAGECATLDQSTSDLGALSARIASYQVERF